MFRISTTTTLGDGTNTSFWQDRWINGKSPADIAPDLMAFIRKRGWRRRTVAEALPGQRWSEDIAGGVSVVVAWQGLQLAHAIEGIVLNNNLAPSADEVGFKEWWRRAARKAPCKMRKGLNSVVILTSWSIWKYRNKCVFDGLRPRAIDLMREIADEAAAWRLAGAKSLLLQG
ncbi:hypothetical protein PR202_gb28629 [Eleusine coracana subsp. coracana]|uniref:Uncharacterized protein n=1 Tax=Eleusine coracana subsp. coracana TaxID=191504 RepID=A0AAV5FWW7_ELECO|nr:hypothetical protein PR202_gb28629 [Eleusine coracana subsp. coracana]